MHSVLGRTLAVVLAVSFSGLASLVSAGQGDSGGLVIVRASTLGIGLEVGKDLDSYRIRAGGHFFSLNTDQKIGQIDYEIEANLAYASVILDWFPGENGFHLSAGLLYNADDIKARSKEALGYVPGGGFIPAADNGRLVADVEYPAFAPFAGVGWEGLFSQQGSMGWLIEAGASYLGNNTVTMTSEDIAGGLADELSQEALVVEDYFDKYSFLPVVTLGLFYSF